MTLRLYSAGVEARCLLFATKPAGSSSEGAPPLLALTATPIREGTGVTGRECPVFLVSLAIHGLVFAWAFDQRALFIPPKPLVRIEVALVPAAPKKPAEPTRPAPLEATPSPAGVQTPAASPVPATSKGTLRAASKQRKSRGPPRRVFAPIRARRTPAVSEPVPIARRAAAPEPALPPEEPEIARLAARYLDHPLPSYPAIAKRAGWEGRVLLRVQVLADGRCGHAAVHSGSGYEALDRTAIDAVCGWRFVPAKRGEIAVASWVLVPLAFKLER